jgi:uroporphyrinogen-III synthase
MGDRSSAHSRHAALNALVTRPRAEAVGLAEALAARGIAALLEPLLDIRFIDAPAPDLAGVQAILCTSANGVRALARLSGERGLPLLAVGEATAARARSEGFAAVESAAGNVDDLIRLVYRRLRPEAGRLLHVAGTVLAGDLAGGLRRHGFAVDRAALYEARPATLLSPEVRIAFEAGSIDFALFFSPRTAAIFARLAGDAGLAVATRSVTAVSLSIAADAALADLPFRQRWISQRPDQAGLLRTLDQALVERQDA